MSTEKRDQKFHRGVRDRIFEYSTEEKAALVAMESVLLSDNISSNKAAQFIAEIWDQLGPVRDPWPFANKHQALRRSLKRWRDDKG